MGWLRRLLGEGPERGRARAGEDELEALERAIEDEKLSDAAVLKRVRRARKAYPEDPEVAVLAGSFYHGLQRYGEAREAYRQGIIDEDRAYPLTMIAATYVEEGELDSAHEHLTEALVADAQLADTQYWKGVLHDLDGRDKAAMACFQRAAAADPDSYFVPARVSERDFERLAQEAWWRLERRYPGFGQDLEGRNVIVHIQPTPTREQIERDGFHPLWLGVFEGHTAVERSVEDPWSALPARIILFQRNLERECASLAELAEQVEITLLHEVAHAHGREEDWMEDRGLA